MSSDTFTVITTTWGDHARLLGEVRRRVFIEEQRIPEELEWDGLDNDCLHVLALDTHQNPIGTGRLSKDGHIGRMAVLRAWRYRGVGTALLQALLELARHSGNRLLVLNAQTTATGFYTGQGFRVEGDEFMDANIPHLKMTITI